MDLEEGELVVEDAKQPKEKKEKKEKKEIKQPKEKPMKSKEKKDKDKSKKKSKNEKEFTSSTYKTKQCEFYKKGGCQKGETCTFSHDFPLEINNTLCRFFLGGACTKENCVFSHEKSKFPCRYYHVLDNCESGTFCQFSHQAMDEETLKAFIQENETFIKESYQKYGYVKLKIPNLINQPVNNQPKSLANYYYPEQNEISQPNNNFENRNVPPLIQRMGAQMTNFNRVASNSNPFPTITSNFQTMVPPGPSQTSMQINQIPHQNMTANFTRSRPNIGSMPMSFSASNNYMPNPGQFNNMPPPGLNPQHPPIVSQFPPMNPQHAGQFNYNNNNNANIMNQNSYYQPNLTKMPVNMLNNNEMNFRNTNMNNNFQNNRNIGNNIINNQNINNTIKSDNFSAEKTIDKNFKNINEIIKNNDKKELKATQPESKIAKEVENNLNISDKNKNKKSDKLQNKPKNNDFIKFGKNNVEKNNPNLKRKAGSPLNVNQQNTKKFKTNDFTTKKETNKFNNSQINRNQMNVKKIFPTDKVKNKGNNAIYPTEIMNKQEKIENKDQLLFSNENEDINKILKNIIFKRKIRPILEEESKIKEEIEYNLGEKKPDVLKRLDQILNL